MSIEVKNKARVPDRYHSGSLETEVQGLGVKDEVK